MYSTFPFTRTRRYPFGVLIAVGVMLAWPCTMFGQSEEYGPEVDATEEPPVPPVPPAWRGRTPEYPDYDSQPPYDYYDRHWRYRMRAYRGSRFSRDYYPWDDPYRYRDWRGYPRYRGYSVYPRGPYDYGYGYAYPYDPAFDYGYERGHDDGRRFAEWEFRYQVGVRSYTQAMETGVEMFIKGDYATAVRQFMLAAKLNQGDAASRLHAAHAMVAQGRYAEAALSVRRALQLQPKLVYLPLDIRREYGRKQDFEKHYQQLKDAATQAPDDAELYFLLGYYQFFAGRAAEAYRSLQKSDALDPGNRTTKRLLDAAKLSTPAEPKSKQPSPQPDAKQQMEGKTS
ncbi:MAG: hypothetical protein JSV19_02465 [Phycisphaerales bacterium]|nr:MAG: hypothetical protein JSV19_02465 [Phycisphaerales bacterium]